MENLYDVIVIGSGPAGITAGIYGRRAGLSTLIIEGNYIQGGQILNTYEVDNYPGLQGVGGFELASKLRSHADAMGAEIITAEVKEVALSGDVKRVVTEDAVYEGKTVILATGATHRKLGVPGEEELLGAGVSYCATCDGAFFRGKEDALFLSRISSKVYLIHRRDEFRGVKSLQEKVFAAENIEIIWNTVAEEVVGDGKVEALALQNRVTGETYSLSVQGVFVAVGIQPNTELFRGMMELDKSGYICAGEEGNTSIPGVFAAGDVRTKQLRQVITAAADGANAVTSVEHYLNSLS